MDVRFKQNRMKLHNCNKTVCMTFKAKTPKSTVIPLLTLGVQRVTSVSHYKYLLILLDIKLSDGKNIQRQLQYNYAVNKVHYAVNKLRSSFSRFSNLMKNVLFRSFFTSMCRSQVWCDFIQEGIHPQIACGLEIWLQGSEKPAVASEC